MHIIASTTQPNYEISNMSTMEPKRSSATEAEIEDDATAITETSSVSTSGTSTSTSSSQNPKKSTKSGKKRKKKAKKRRKKKGRNDGKKDVTFGTTEILEFNYTIAHQSVTDKGVPIGLGSTLIRSKTISVSKFEKRRTDRNVELTPDARRRILLKEGFSNDEILEANQTSMLVRISRKQSVMYMKWDDWEAKKERVGRHVRKWTNPKVLYKRSTQLLRRSSELSTPTEILVQ
jgi:hypothetical protein